MRYKKKQEVKDREKELIEKFIAYVGLDEELIDIKELIEECMIE